MSKYLYHSQLRPLSGQPQSCMDRHLALTRGARAAEPAAHLGACSFPAATAASNLPLSCLVWGVLSVTEDERDLLPCGGDWGGGLGRYQHWGTAITGLGA